MAESKKISFGFSKILKKPTVVAPKKEEKEIQFIDCLEGNNIKLANGEEKVKEALVIPLKNGNILRDNMIEALKARKEENSTKNGIIKKDKSENSITNSERSENESEKKPLTLDELAAKEILEDLKKSNESEVAKDVRNIPATTTTSLGEKESTLEDYENIPINEFGLAMLRGMGWAPDKGVGKNGLVVQPVNPVVRPKGMGLGADKAMPTVTRTASGEELVMKKNAALKIISGPYVNLYGTVEGFDELPGRIMVRLTLQNNVISISENLVQLVTMQEFNKNSKILNLNDYNKYYEEMESKKNVGKTLESNIKIEPNDIDSEPEQSDRKIKAEKLETRRNKGRSYSSSPERSKKYIRNSGEAREDKKKAFSRKERSASTDSDEQHTDKRDRQEKTAQRHEKEKYSRYRRNSSSEPEEKYRRHKSKKEKRSPSSSSEDHKKTKSHKNKRRNRSPSSDYEEEKQKGKKSYKSESKCHSSSHSKKKDKRKKSSIDSSDSEIEKKSQRKHEVSNHKQNRKDRNETSDYDSENRERRKKHKSYSRQRSTSRSPTRKKKKKHHRSRS